MEFNNSIEYNLFLSRFLDVTELLKTEIEKKLNDLERTIFNQEQMDKALGIVEVDSYKVFDQYNKYKLEGGVILWK